MIAPSDPPPPSPSNRLPDRPLPPARPNDAALAAKLIGLPLLWLVGGAIALIMYDQHVCDPSSFMCVRLSSTELALWFAGSLGVPALTTTAALTSGSTRERLVRGLIVAGIVTAVASAVALVLAA
ncbi:MAG: hypothetical protein R2733_25515 [Acidimicrobiales bacterium]